MRKKRLDVWCFFFDLWYLLLRSTLDFYRHSQCFIAFLRFSSFAVWTRFGFKKSPKKPPKTTSKPLKNQVWKRCVFKHRFFAFLAPFWHVLGSSWASLGSLWASKMASKRVGDIGPRQFFFQLMSFSFLFSIFLRFGRVLEWFWRGLGRFFGVFWGDFG